MRQLILCGNVAYESVRFLGIRRIPAWPAEDGLADETVGFNREGAGKSHDNRAMVPRELHNPSGLRFAHPTAAQLLA